MVSLGSEPVLLPAKLAWCPGWAGQGWALGVTVPGSFGGSFETLMLPRMWPWTQGCARALWGEGRALRKGQDPRPPLTGCSGCHLDLATDFCSGLPSPTSICHCSSVSFLMFPCSPSSQQGQQGTPISRASWRVSDFHAPRSPDLPHLRWGK